MELKDLEIYKLAKEISNKSWKIYEKLNWQDKKIMGDQFISATDSIGANIAEGFGRFHFLDKNKFNYNYRGSLLESIYWLEILQKRSKINNNSFHEINSKLKILHQKLNNYINSTKRQTYK
ncbi:MAG: four helix bundle protein [Patescibacteria group bacterium]|nr:four helix bundle protein [Patescibacteria group bacterium]